MTSSAAKTRCLHLFGNWKWTGPAEPAVNLCRTLQERFEVRLAIGCAPRGQRHLLREEVAARGVPTVEDLLLPKHLELAALRDVRGLRRLLRRWPCAVVHVHQTADHVVASLALGGLLERPLILRSYYGAGDEPIGLRDRWALRRCTDGAIVFNAGARRALIEGLRLPADRVLLVEGAVDTRRFDPDRLDRRAARARLGFGEDDLVVGIVARFQARRRFDVFLEAIRSLHARCPRARALMIGKGEDRKTAGIDAAAALGIAAHVDFPGYLRGDDYAAALLAMDIGVLLKPGSDSTVRAVREMMAMGLPMVVGREGALPEIVAGGEAGLIVEPDDPAALAEAFVTLAEDPDRRAALAHCARAIAHGRYTLPAQGAEVAAFYRERLEAPGSGPVS